MKILLMIILFAPFSANPLEVIIDPYSDLEYDDISVYYIDQEEPYQDYGCFCPCY